MTILGPTHAHVGIVDKGISLEETASSKALTYSKKF